MLQPKTVTIDLADGTTKAYILSKFPAIAGREIIAKYPLSSMPKLGDYAVNQETMLKLMTYVSAPVADGEPIQLVTAALVDNHVPDWETLTKLEIAMMEYNCSFFTNGALHGFIDLLLEKAAPLLSQILTNSLQLLSQVEKRLTSNSETT